MGRRRSAWVRSPAPVWPLIVQTAAILTFFVMYPKALIFYLAIAVTILVPTVAVRTYRKLTGK